MMSAAVLCAVPAGLPQPGAPRGSWGHGWMPDPEVSNDGLYLRPQGLAAGVGIKAAVTGFQVKVTYVQVCHTHTFLLAMCRQQR